jgi:hypothetical protein
MPAGHRAPSSISRRDAPFVLKRLQASGEIQGPRIFTAHVEVPLPARK